MPSQENLDYQNALEVIRDVAIDTEHKLSKEAVAGAEELTKYTGVTAVQNVFNQAEDFTYVAGVVAPEDTIETAEIITKSHAVEVVAAGEDLHRAEQLAETPVANEAELILKVHNSEPQ
jgi:hypothetical protein